MAMPTTLRIAHLHPEPRTFDKDARLRLLDDQVRALRQALDEARTEIGLLTAERDELVDALRTWGRSSEAERSELL